MLRFAVDAMGGDDAPDEIVRGCLDALPELNDDDHLILVGDGPVIQDIIHERGAPDPRVEIVHTDSTIEMHESPVEAVRAKQDSSLVRMIALGSARKSKDPVDVVISAGNTGACVSAATMYMKRLRGVHRPGIACVIPALHGPVVMCDVGANPEPRPTHLAQYGLMAETYARRTLGIDHPRVAVLNIGSEESKGTGMVKEVRDLLESVPGMNFIGYVEGRDLFEGRTDVVITDGFVGNITLKLAEGLARSLFGTIAHEVFEHNPDLAIELQPVMASLFKKNDYHEYGGAPLLGVNGVCIICHGSSKARTIKSTILRARNYVDAGVNDAIVRRIGELDEGAAERSADEAVA